MDSLCTIINAKSAPPTASFALQSKILNVRCVRRAMLTKWIIFLNQKNGCVCLVKRAVPDARKMIPRHALNVHLGIIWSRNYRNVIYVK